MCVWDKTVPVIGVSSFERNLLTSMCVNLVRGGRGVRVTLCLESRVRWGAAVFRALLRLLLAGSRGCNKTQGQNPRPLTQDKPAPMLLWLLTSMYSISEGRSRIVEVSDATLFPRTFPRRPHPSRRQQQRYPRAPLPFMLAGHKIHTVITHTLSRVNKPPSLLTWLLTSMYSIS